MTELELGFFERLDEEISERAREICNYLDLLHRSSVETLASDGKIILDIVDYEGDCVDSLTMTYEQFCSPNYLNEAKRIRATKLEEKKRQEAEARKARAEEERKNRRELYEELKKEFE